MTTRYHSLALGVALVAIVTSVSMCVLSRAESSESPESLRPNDMFRNLIQQRVSAVAQGDVAAYHRHSQHGKTNRPADADGEASNGTCEDQAAGSISAAALTNIDCRQPAPGGPS